MENKAELERYSFSKLNSFLTCRHGYAERYLKNQKGESNAFSSYGTFLHSLVERHAKGEISLRDLPSIYEWEFDTAVPEEFPPMPRFHAKYGLDMRRLYYDQGLSFLNNFQGYSNVKVLDVEAQFDFPIGDFIFNGIIDLVVEEIDGRLIIKDYKSKSSFKSIAEKKEYTRQLYLYSLRVKEKYGRYPDELRFVLIRKNEEVIIPFKESDLQEAINWAKETVSIIRHCWDWFPTRDDFFCQHLCNFKNTCEYRIQTEEENE